MDPFRIAVRTVAAFVYLLAMARLTGKRMVSQTTSFDFVVALIVGDMIEDALWAEVPMAKFAVGAGTLFITDILVTIAAFRWQAFHRLVEGIPVRVLLDGREDEAALRGEQLNEGDLSHLVRARHRETWEGIHTAYLERSDELSIVLTPDAQPAQRADAERAREVAK